MLSEKIRNLKTTLEQALNEDRVTRDMMEITLQRLAAIAEQAEILENSAIPLPAQLTDDNVPFNVFRLAERLHRGGVTVGIPKADGGGS